MNPVQLLKDDHRDIQELFRQYEAANRSSQEAKRAAQQALLRFEVHSKIEEEIFYPALQAQGNGELQMDVTEGIHDHQMMDILIDEIKTLNAGTERFDNRFRELIQLADQHIGDEERDVLPSAEAKLGNEFLRIGQRMADRQQQLLQQLGQMPRAA